MKKADLLTAAVNTLLAALVSLCGIGCLITGFGLNVSSSVVLCCLIFAAAACFCLRLRRGWLVLPIFAAVLGLMLYRGGLESLLGLAYALMRFYQMGYGWSIPDFLRAYAVTDLSLGFACLAALSAFISGISLTRQRTSGAITMATLLLAPCLVVTDTVPAPLFLAMMLLCVTLLALTKNVRWADPHQGRKLTAMLLIPVILFTSVLFSANPQDEYTPPKAQDPAEFLQELLDGLPLPDFTIPPFSIPSLGLPGGDQPVVVPGVSNKVDLGNKGPQLSLFYLVMELQTDFSGIAYLRGQGYGEYTGTQWISDSGTETFPVESTYLSQQAENSLTVLTKSGLPLRYLPYYPSESYTLSAGAVTNPDKETRFFYSITPLQTGWQTAWRTNNPQTTAGNVLEALPDFRDYTTLPQETLSAAREILSQIGVTEDTPLLEAVEIIQKHVQNSATYSLNTPSMPENAADFAIWFLTESDTGYCVHFASAATVLLRSAGIPARYVEGYAAPVTAGETNRVLQNMAHAWVEYYVPDVGWVNLEATPSGSASTPAPTTQPTPSTTRPTAPPVSGTEPSSSATQPTTVPTTVPSSATQPSTPAASTAPIGGVDPPVDPQPVPWLQTLLIWTLLTAAFAAAAIAQWKLRLRWKQRKFREGSSNAQALRRWQETRMLAKLRRQDAPEALHELALKAKFSQHTISDEELAQFDGYFARSIDHLKQRPWFLQLCYRLIFAAY